MLSSISILFFIALCGVILHLRNKRNYARYCFLFFIFYFFIISISPLPLYLVHWLEKPFYNRELDASKAKYILVLGAGYTDDSKLDDFQKLSIPGAARLTHAIILKKRNPHLKIIFSGKSKNQSISVAEAMSKAATYFGVPDEDVYKFNRTENTFAEAIQYKSFFKDDPVIVISSASHLKRVSVIFNDLKINHQVYAADFLVKESPNLKNYNFKPSSEKIVLMDRFVHEILGRLYYNFFLKKS